MEMRYIYCLIDPRNGDVRYVGRTGNIKGRMTKHNSVGTGKGTFKHEFIKELKAAGIKKVDYEILDVVPKEEGRFWEEFYTDLFRSWGFDLLNNKYYKMGNQTSFQPGTGCKPVVALTSDGIYHSEYPSIKSAKEVFGKIALSQALARNEKLAGGMIWFWKSEYETLTKEQIDLVVEWTKPNFHVNSGSFKVGMTTWNKVHVPADIASQMVRDRVELGLSVAAIERKYSYGNMIVRRILKENSAIN